MGAAAAASAMRVWGANERVNVAIVGLGGRGSNHLSIYSKLAEWKMHRDDHDKYQAVMEDLIVPYDMDLALRTGVLRGLTALQGLSLGDRACLSLAQRLGVPVLTSDKIWSNVQVGVTIEMIR